MKEVSCLPDMASLSFLKDPLLKLSVVELLKPKKIPDAIGEYIYS